LPRSRRKKKSVKRRSRSTSNQALMTHPSPPKATHRPPIRHRSPLLHRKNGTEAHVDGREFACCCRRQNTRVVVFRVGVGQSVQSRYNCQWMEGEQDPTSLVIGRSATSPTTRLVATKFQTNASEDGFCRPNSRFPPASKIVVTLENRQSGSLRPFPLAVSRSLQNGR
jgi:hypothetical protein